MTIYTDYAYYKEEYAGDIIPENSFKKYAREASNKVKYFTFNRIDSFNVSDDIKNVTCLIAELLFNQETLKMKITDLNNDSQQIASETLGPRSISYVNNLQYKDKQIKTEQELNECIYKACKENLDGKLLYRGF